YSFITSHCPSPPHPGYHGLAEPALFPNEVIGRDEIPLAFDEEFAAGMAVGVVPFMLRDIAHIDIPYSLLHGELTEMGQDGDRRCAQAVELVHGEESQEMKRF